MGPLQISCRKLQGEEVQIIYWKVSGEHIHGTTAAHQASQFYIKRKDDKTFTISHKPDGVTTQSVTFQELQPEERAYSPLKLVRSANVSFSLKNVDKKKSVQLPPTEMDWKERSPFFIKPYKQTSVRCTVVVEQYQQPGTKYTIATCASKDGEDGLMLFYFEPAIKNLPGVTLGHGSSGPPPPPRPSPSPTIRPSRIESDSGTPDTEPVPPPPPPPLDKINPGATPKHDQDDIDRIFTELVGDDYVFPI